MKVNIVVLFSLLSTIAFHLPVFSQTISKEEMVFLTSEWKGERFSDGRPKIDDKLLERAKLIMIDDA